MLLYYFFKCVEDKPTELIKSQVAISNLQGLDFSFETAHQHCISICYSKHIHPRSLSMLTASLFSTSLENSLKN